jgi:histidinol-phosphatase
MTDYSKYLETAVKAARLSEEVILKYYSSDLKIEAKSDNSPVTIADKEAERIIRETIKERFPDHGFFGEEFGESQTASDCIWIIDPIDGTKNYTHGIPLFATQIALMYKNEVVVGVSNAPVLHELLSASKGEGTTLNGKDISVSKKQKLSEAYLSFGSLNSFKKNNQSENLSDLIEHSYTARGFGDAWSYHLLAQGKIDAMIEASTKIWDIAAVSLIVEEAGGRVTDISGNKITKDTTSIIATNNKIHEPVLNYFK